LIFSELFVNPPRPYKNISIVYIFDYFTKMRNKFTITTLLVILAFTLLYSMFGTRTIREGIPNQQTSTQQTSTQQTSTQQTSTQQTSAQQTSTLQANAQQNAVDQNLGKLIEKCTKNCNSAAPVGKKNICFKNCFGNGGNVRY
jgi:hypothetical protein